MAEEKTITFAEIFDILEAANLRYQALMYSRTPEAADGTRVLYAISDSNDTDNVRTARIVFWNDYGISLQIVASNNSNWIDRSFRWM